MKFFGWKLANKNIYERLLPSQTLSSMRLYDSASDSGGVSFSAECEWNKIEQFVFQILVHISAESWA